MTDISIPIIATGGSAIAVITCPFIRRIDRHVGPDLEATHGLLERTAKALSITVPRSLLLQPDEVIE